MFDWDDEELTNIIWGEAGECDDHIVPYPDKIEEKPQVLFGDIHKKEANQETSNISFLEKKKSTIKSEAVVELDSSTRYETRDPEKGFGLNSWSDGTDASLSNAAKVDGNSVSANASNDVTKSTKYGTLTDETAQVDKDSKLFQNIPEGREDGDFVDYDWANIGSFEDLDNIFSNNDPIFGDTSMGNTDELLSTPLSDSSDLPLKLPDNSSDISKTGYEKLNEGTSHTQGLEMSGKIQACLKQSGDVCAATVNELPRKLSSCAQGNRQKRLPKNQTTDKKQPHDAYGSWSSSTIPYPPVNNTYPLPMVNPCPPLVLSQQQRLQQKHFSGPLLASPPLYGNMVNNYPATSALAPPSGYEVPDGNTTIKPPAMSPREKIEKLRRRQKMRAMLAIQRQQQQFGNQVEHPNMEGGKMEVDETVSNFPSIEPNLPMERDDLNAISMAVDNCSVEESVLRRLQDTIANLDTGTRLSIRDSMFRLANSAMQRQFPNDISSASTSSKYILVNKDIGNHERFTRMPDIETDTNPIDRTVAHLLFHRPLEFSGKHAETPASPNFPYERRETSSIKLQEGPQSFMNTQMTSPQGSNTHGLFGDTSENASTNDDVDGGSKMVEAPK